MVSVVRQILVNRLTDTVRTGFPALADHWHDNADKLAWCIRAGTVTDKKKDRVDKVHFKIPYKYLLGGGFSDTGTRREESIAWAKIFTPQVQQGDEILNVSAGDYAIDVDVDPAFFTRALLKSMIVEHSKHGLNSILHNFRYGALPNSTQKAVQPQAPHQSILVEYSSPNIAKRFHWGHLRSTIIGNFVGNIHEELGHKVIRINYLGDWGTQFGLLGVGFQEYGSMEKLKDHAMQHLFEIYVTISGKAGDAQDGTKVHNDGMNFFLKMEQGDPEALALWQMCRSYSIEEYSKVYERLGVHFDEYHGEAMYYKKSLKLVQAIKDKGLLKYHSGTGVGYVDLTSDLTSQEPETKQHHVDLLKSDGSTLYVTRDLAAAIHRKEVYNFDKMYYVVGIRSCSWDDEEEVENGQHLHFTLLFKALQKLGHTWADDLMDKAHVKFGRIEGMSSRRGNVVFLSDILDEAQRRMVELMQKKETTKVTELSDVRNVADKLAVSAIIIFDLKDHRGKNYVFDWDKILRFNGNTGVFLQYTHARLSNLEKNCGYSIDVDCDTEALVEPHAYRIVQHLARFDEIVHFAHMELEPYHVVQYMFELAKLVNRGLENLQIKGEAADVARARLMLFHCAKKTLATGLRIVGVEPIREM